MNFLFKHISFHILRGRKTERKKNEQRISGGREGVDRKSNSIESIRKYVKRRNRRKREKTRFNKKRDTHKKEKKDKKEIIKKEQRPLFSLNGCKKN